METKDEPPTIISTLQAIHDRISANSYQSSPSVIKKKRTVKTCSTFRKDYVAWTSSDEEKDNTSERNGNDKRVSKRKQPVCNYNDDTDYKPAPGTYVPSEDGNQIKRGRGRPKKPRICEEKVQDESLLSLSRVLSKAELRRKDEKSAESCDSDKPKMKRGRGRPRKFEDTHSVGTSSSQSYSRSLVMESGKLGEGIFELSSDVNTEDLMKDAELSTTALEALAFVYQEENNSEVDAARLGLTFGDPEHYPPSPCPSTSSTYSTPDKFLPPKPEPQVKPLTKLQRSPPLNAHGMKTRRTTSLPAARDWLPPLPSAKGGVKKKSVAPSKIYVYPPIRKIQSNASRNLNSNVKKEEPQSSTSRVISGEKPNSSRTQVKSGDKSNLTSEVIISGDKSNSDRNQVVSVEKSIASTTQNKLGEKSNSSATQVLPKEKPTKGCSRHSSQTEQNSVTQTTTSIDLEKDEEEIFEDLIDPSSGLIEKREQNEYCDVKINDVDNNVYEQITIKVETTESSTQEVLVNEATTKNCLVENETLTKDITAMSETKEHLVCDEVVKKEIKEEFGLSCEAQSVEDTSADRESLLKKEEITVKLEEDADLDRNHTEANKEEEKYDDEAIDYSNIPSTSDNSIERYLTALSYLSATSSPNYCTDTSSKPGKPRTDKSKQTLQRKSDTRKPNRAAVTKRKSVSVAESGSNEFLTTLKSLKSSSNETSNTKLKSSKSIPNVSSVSQVHSIDSTSNSASLRDEGPLGQKRARGGYRVSSYPPLTPPPTPTKPAFQVSQNKPNISKPVFQVSQDKPNPTKRTFQVTPDNWYTCDKCGTIFKFVSTYRYHMATDCNTKAPEDEGQKGFQCTQCPKQLASRTSLMVHLRLHSGERPFPCPHCTVAFYQKHHLRDHVDKIHLHPKEFSCSGCATKCVGYVAWKAHLAECRKEIERRKRESHLCRICNVMCSSKEELQSHTMRHTSEERRYACVQCTRRFHSASLLARHASTHASHHDCPLCGKKFTCKRRYTQHMARHEGALNQTCAVCPAKFYSAYELKQHMRSHTDERPFPCPVCQRAFRRKATMELHLTLHTGAKPYACSKCDEKFNRNSKLQIHTSVVHNAGDMFQCCHCAKQFPCKSYLIPHMRLHTGEKPYACALCDFKVARSSELRLHLRKHHREDARNPYAPVFVSVEDGNNDGNSHLVEDGNALEDDNFVGGGNALEDGNFAEDGIILEYGNNDGNTLRDGKNNGNALEDGNFAEDGNALGDGNTSEYGNIVKVENTFEDGKICVEDGHTLVDSHNVEDGNTFEDGNIVIFVKSEAEEAMCEA